MKKSLCFIAVGFIVFECLWATTEAATITIVNPGFEDPVLDDGARTTGITGTPGWTQSQQGNIDALTTDSAVYFGAGAYNPTAATYGYDEPPEGHNAGHMRSSNNPRYTALKQTLSATLQANMTYTLKVMVGNPVVRNTNTNSPWNPLGMAPDYQIRLLAGGVSIVDSGRQLAPMDTTWITTSITITTDAGHPQLGQPLEIWLIGYPLNAEIVNPDCPGNCNWGGFQLDFDDVRLETGDPLSKAHEPDPAYGQTGVPVNQTLSWKTGLDPGNPSVPNPAIVRHNVWLSIPYNPDTPLTSLGAIQWNDPVQIGADTNPADGSVDPTASYAPALQNEALYYWIVDEDIGASSPTDWDNLIVGDVWRFETELADTPPEVDAGDDRITWYGQAVQLNPTVIDDGASPLFYAWSANPAEGVEFSPIDVPDPIVTITKAAVAVTVPNAGFEVRETYDPFPEATDKYNQYDQESWRHFECDNNGGPLRIWNPGVPGVDETDQGVMDVGFSGNAPEGNYVVVVRTRYNDDEFHDPPQVRDFEAAVQLLDATFDPALRYVLTAKVGRMPEGTAEGGSINYTPAWYGYALQLAVGGANVDGASYQGRVEGGTVVAQDWNSVPVPINGFATTTVVCDPDPANDYLAGQPLQIRLCALEKPDDHSLTGWVVFDDVSLSAESTGASTGGASYALTLEVSDAVNQTPVIDTMTIDVYDDGCQAARIGMGLAAENPGDLDGNCITDFNDFALMAARWLDNFASTEPVVK